jgi:hypothetical protein
MIQVNISIKGTGRLSDILWALKSLISSLLVSGSWPQTLTYGYRGLHVNLEMTETPELPKTGEDQTVTNSNQ